MTNAGTVRALFLPAPFLRGAAAPQTGDGSNLLLWVIVLAAAALGLLALALWLKKSANYAEKRAAPPPEKAGRQKTLYRATGAAGAHTAEDTAAQSKGPLPPAGRSVHKRRRG